MVYPTSVAFTQAVRSSHRLAMFCDVIYDGIVIYEDVPIVAGSVSEDRTRFVRRDGTITVSPTLAPSLLSWTDTLVPNGAEIKPKRGVYLAGNSFEVVPLGVLLIVDVDLDRDGQVVVRVQDRAARMAEDKLIGGYDASGLGTQAVVDALVARTYPDLTVTWDVTLTDPTIPGGTVFTGTAAAAVQSLVAGVGGEFRFDADGDPEVVPLPTLAAAVSVETLNEGADGVIVSRRDKLTRTDAYNAVVVTGESVGDGETPFGAAYITSGPMDYYGGVFGRIVKEVSAPNLTTDAACQDRADELIGDGVGLPHTVDLSILPNPALQAGDGVMVVNSLGGVTRHLLARVTVDLSARGAMAATTAASPWEPPTIGYPSSATYPPFYPGS